jgi:L-amino acid N-acyltransferase YncA
VAPVLPAIRTASEADIAAITEIYAAEVRDFVNTYEYEAPDEAEMRRRMQGIVEAGYPYLVAEVNGQIAGYAYASSFRARIGYRFTVENSVYVAEEWQGRGIGSALLGRLITDCESRGFRQMVAVIGEAANAGSIRLHERFGFRPVGTFPGIGLKHGRWLDTVFMQLSLGSGADTPA